jgi:hypothetical protein
LEGVIAAAPLAKTEKRAAASVRLMIGVGIFKRRAILAQKGIPRN